MLRPTPNNRRKPVDIIDFHVAHTHTHAHEVTHKPVKQMAVTLERRERHDCKSGSSKWNPTSIPFNTDNRANNRMFRVFVGLRGNKYAMPVGGNMYPRNVMDVFSRYAWEYFISHRPDPIGALETFLADLVVEDIS